MAARVAVPAARPAAAAAGAPRRAAARAAAGGPKGGAAAADGGRRSALLGGAAALVAAASAPALAPPPALAFDNPEPLDDGFKRFYGKAASASSYGGGATGNKSAGLDAFRYLYEVPDYYVQDTIGKIEKATQGVDSRWRGKRGEMYYVVSIPGFAKLGKERDEVLENLAVSNIELQDKIYQQLDYKDYEKTLGDQLYYCYELVTDKDTTLVSVTAYGGRFYGAFVVAPKSLVTEDQDKYYRMVDSFSVIEKANAKLEERLTMAYNS